MHICNFCSTEYEARPQVKNPRACTNCQSLRQRANEKAWRTCHHGLYDKKYHRIKKIQRDRVVGEMIDRIKNSLKIGMAFKEDQFNLELFSQYFSKLFNALGLRRLNKLWLAN